MNKSTADLLIGKPATRTAEPSSGTRPLHQPVLPGFFTEWQMETPSGMQAKTA